MQNATLAGPPFQPGVTHPLDMLTADPVPAGEGRQAITGTGDGNGRVAGSREDED